MFNLSVLRFVTTVVVAISMAGNITLALSCDANLTEPNFYVHGLCFSPYLDGQEAGDYIPPEQIQQRLLIITQRSHMEWIRTYGATNGLQDIPAEANSLGLKVAMGTWIRHNREQEVNNLVAKAQLGLVDVAVVGNEELAAYEDGDPSALTPAEYFDLLADVRQQLNDANCAHIPIAAAEPFEALFTLNGKGIAGIKHTELLNNIDILLLNIYPFWKGFPADTDKGAHIDIARDVLALKYQLAIDKIALRAPNVAVMLGETGWSSDGLTHGDAEPSLVNLARYFFEVSNWAQDNNVPLFYFAAFDEKWKAPPELKAHWGIWDSNGHLKQSFITEPVLCETFDGPLVNPFHAEIYWDSNAPDPNILVGDPSCEDKFLRLLYDGTGETHYSYVAFDRVAVGSYPRIEVEFDFRLHGPDANDDADGFSFMLLPTSLHGITGSTRYGNHQGIFAEEPKLPKTFAVGFDVWDGDGPNDLICVSWDGRWFPEDSGRFDAPFDLDNGVFHHAKIDLRSNGSNGALVTISLTQDICAPDHNDPITVVDNLSIDDPNHPYEPYENRVEFAGRNGWYNRDINADIDNILIHWKPDICESLEGDVNQDCKVDFSDFALMANDWLINCNLNPDDPTCISE